MFLPRMGFGLPTLVLSTVCVILSGTAQADPIRITTVKAFSGSSPGEISTVDLAESPGAILGGQQVDFGTTVRAVVTFEAILNGRQSGILRETFEWPKGWEPPFSNLVHQGPVDGADAIVFGMDFPLVYHPVPVTLTLSVPGEPGGGIIGPDRFRFSVMQPTPEPSAITLFGAVAGVTFSMVGYRRRGRLTRFSADLTITPVADRT